MQVILFKGHGMISQLIKWQTRGEYSHAALLLNGTLYEAWQGSGVQKKEKWIFPKDGTVISFSILFPGYSKEHEANVEKFLNLQVGKGYDYLAILRFITRTKIFSGEQNRWFCSELVFAALDSAGIQLFRWTKAYEVSPDLLKRSVVLIKD